MFGGIRPNRTTKKPSRGLLEDILSVTKINYLITKYETLHKNKELKRKSKRTDLCSRKFKRVSENNKLKTKIYNFFPLGKI